MNYVLEFTLLLQSFVRKIFLKVKVWCNLRHNFGIMSTLYAFLKYTVNHTVINDTAIHKLRNITESDHQGTGSQIEIVSLSIPINFIDI